MKKDLQKLYWMMLVPAISILVFIELIRYLNIASVNYLTFTNFFAPFIFVLAVIFSIAFPIFYRSWFANKIKGYKSVTIYELISYEKRTLILVLVSPYLAAVALLFQFPKFYFSAIIMLALYGCYYYYPSEKRINFEKRIFRII